MTPAEYLDAAKEKLALTSDYALAKTIGHQTSHVADFRSGKRHIPDDVKLWLSTTLAMDLASIVGDLGSQREKNLERAKFLRSFVQEQPRKAAAWLLAFASVAAIGITAPNDVYASDTFNVSLPALKAAPLQGSADHVIVIM